ncbi:MAG TPA: DUF4870 domain-containing protein [Anaerolineae bacterium]|nr:DUF4870 domain-containing protein [Anaerolineae bacterium]HID84571.1 DUF4870 domain-containing protein [Anaerolineales bacterium]HIQ09859.1 DUF4870 domain-containing protein [Anaerolineaceae bacterium]
MSEQIPVSPGTTADEPSSDDRLWALLAYILSPIVPIIALLMEEKKSRPYIRFHSVQALVLGVINIVLSLALSATIVLACIPLFIWLYMIYLGVLAYQSKPFTVPFLTDFIQKQGWA